MSGLSCENCGHRQSFLKLGGADRCCRFKNMLTEYAYEICKGEYYFDKGKGLSLYAFQEWFKLLSDDEKEMPLGVHVNGRFVEPIMVLKSGSRDGWQWIIYCKGDCDDEGC